MATSKDRLKPICREGTISMSSYSSDFQAFRDLVVEEFKPDVYQYPVAFSVQEVARRFGLDRWDAFDWLVAWDNLNLEPRVRGFDKNLDGQIVVVFYYITPYQHEQLPRV
jgi:hypothetical protein